MTSAERDLGTLALEVSAVSESVVVSAAQVEIPLSTASSSVTVITREDLEKHQVESVADALRAVPGLAVVANGGRGALTSVFPRGGESDYSLVLVDGVQANAFGGGFDFAHLPMANIERIEIVRGPQSALVWIECDRLGRPHRHAAERRAGRVGIARRRRLRHVPRDRGDVGHGRWLELGCGNRTADDGQLQRPAHGQRRDRRERRLRADARLTAAGGWRQQPRRGIRGNVRRTAPTSAGSPGPFGADPGGTYGGIDTVSRGINDRWLLSAAGNAHARPRPRLSAEATHMRLDSEFASPFGDSESYSRRTTGAVRPI